MQRKQNLERTLRSINILVKYLEIFLNSIFPPFKLLIYILYLTKPVIVGIVIDKAGKYVIKKITITSMRRKGKIAFAIVSTFSPDTEEDATNRTNPIGGVANPTVRFTDIMIAK